MEIGFPNSGNQGQSHAFYSYLILFLSPVLLHARFKKFVPSKDLNQKFGLVQKYNLAFLMKNTVLAIPISN